MALYRMLSVSLVLVVAVLAAPVMTTTDEKWRHGGHQHPAPAPAPATPPSMFPSKPPSSHTPVSPAGPPATYPSATPPSSDGGAKSSSSNATAPCTSPQTADTPAPVPEVDSKSAATVTSFAWLAALSGAVGLGTVMLS